MMSRHINTFQFPLRNGFGMDTMQSLCQFLIWSANPVKTGNYSRIACALNGRFCSDCDNAV